MIKLIVLFLRTLSFYIVHFATHAPILLISMIKVLSTEPHSQHRMLIILQSRHFYKDLVSINIDDMKTSKL